MGKEHNVPVAALIGAKQHAVKQVEAGVDIIVVSGTERWSLWKRFNNGSCS